MTHMFPKRRSSDLMGMALRGRKHAGCLAVGLAQVGVGGTRDQAPRLRAARHFPQHPLEIIRGEGEAVAQGFQRAILALRLRVTGHPQEDAGDQRLGFLVPMRSEERRVGKEGVSPCRSWWSPYHKNKKKRTET